MTTETGGTQNFLAEFRMCDRKAKFGNWMAAEKNAAEALRRYGSKQRPYKCPNCGYYHLKSVR